MCNRNLRVSLNHESHLGDTHGRFSEMGRTVPRFACFDRKERHIRNSPVLPKPRFAPCASLAPREGRPLRVAVSAAYGVSPPCRARGEGTRTDSQRLATRRHVPKGAFRGTRAPSADVTCRAKSRVAVSSRCGAQPQRCPSAQRGGTDSHSGAVGLGEPSQDGDAIQLVSESRDFSLNYITSTASGPM